MKILMLTIAVLAISSTSHAVVADRFRCTLEVKELVSEISTKVEKMFFIARLPLSASPAPDVRLTASQISESLILQTPQAKLSGDLNFYYKHAVKIDMNGVPLEARQLSCISLTGGYCKKPVGDEDTLYPCSASMIACMEPYNPFDPNNGWSPTGLVDGIPTFNQQTMAPVTYNISDYNGNNVGVVNLSCQYMGSFQ